MRFPNNPLSFHALSLHFLSPIVPPSSSPRLANGIFLFMHLLFVCLFVLFVPTIVADHAWGVGIATKFVADVDPSVWPDDETKASIGVKGYIQSALDEARAANGSFHGFTEESKT